MRKKKTKKIWILKAVTLAETIVSVFLIYKLKAKDWNHKFKITKKK